MVLAIIILGLASLVASGVMFRHLRMTTFLAAAGVLWEAQWLLLTYLDRTLLRGFDREAVYMLGAIILMIVWAIGWRRWKLPYAVQAGSGRRDLAVLLVMVPVVLSSLLIANFNGWDGEVWRSYGFFNGDTVTLAALVNKSMLTDGLVNSNPLSGGGYLEYPTLLHAGLASLFAGLGMGVEWLAMWPALTLLQIMLTVPMFFLLADVMFPEPGERWRKWFGVNSRGAILALQGALVLYVMAISWDNFIFPQSHFFLTGIYLLLMAILYSIERAGEKQEVFGVLMAVILAGLLMSANAVTGTAGVILMVVFHGYRVFDKKREIWSRGVHAALVPVWVIVFLMASPGDAGWGISGFSYTAAQAMLRLVPVFGVLLAGAFLYLERRVLAAAMTAALAAAALGVLIFTARKIVAENAERFVYHAVMAAWPLMMAPLIIGFFKFKGVLRHTTLGLVQTVSGWILLAVAVIMAVIPGLVSVASAHDNLLRKDEQVIGDAELALASWVMGGVGQEEIYITDAAAPWYIPFLTGKNILRADRNWLSEQDDVLARIKAAFGGDKEAQEETLQRGDFLVLRVDEIDRWEPLNYVRVYESKKYVVWYLGKSTSGN